MRRTIAWRMVNHEQRSSVPEWFLDVVVVVSAVIVFAADVILRRSM